jgi:hypothetical protein
VQVGWVLLKNFKDLSKRLKDIAKQFKEERRN